jgi:hypothetical protein
MPPVAIAAGIGAVGAVGGAAIQSSAAKKTAKTQRQVANQEAVRLQQNQQYVTSLNQPIIDQGNTARRLIGSFLGTEGGDRAASALATYRGSTGYQDLLNTGLGTVTANAYARGLGASGATLKALQAKGMALADQSSGNWLNGLGNLASAGQNAIGQVAGAATNTTNNITQLQTGAADAVSNAQLAGGAQWSKALQNLANLGGSALGGGGGAGLGSSYSVPQNGGSYGVSPPFNPSLFTSQFGIRGLR